MMTALPKRKRTRLEGFDYTSSNMYFVTICTQGKRCFFGKIVNEEMELNHAGKMVNEYWNKISEKWNHIEIDKFIVMPNHLHGILTFNETSVGVDPRVNPKPLSDQSQFDNSNPHPEMVGHTGPTLPSLSEVMQWFKTMTTNQYIKMVKKGIQPPFKNKLWQRSFYDHIIRNDDDYRNTQAYIEMNPAKWEWDKENLNAGMNA